MNRKTIGLLVIGLLVLAVAMMSGCIKEEKPSEPSAPTKTPTQKTELSLGESAILDDIVFTVVRFEESHEYEYIFNKTVYPAEGAKFLWVWVIAKNVGEVAREVPDRTSRFGDIEMLYKGEKIFTHNMGGSASSLKRKIYDSPGMFSDPLYPGVIEEGWILFEVPEGIDLSQAKIRVDSPTNHTKTVTWIF